MPANMRFTDNPHGLTGTSTDERSPAQVAEAIEARRQINSRMGYFITPILTFNSLHLASSLNSDMPCRIFQPRVEGAYNLCFFLVFPSTLQRWVVRLAKTKPLAYPLEAKISAEIATMTAVRAQTTIPVPKVHAYSARKDELWGGLYGFIVMDFVEGVTLGSILKHGKLACDGRRQVLTETDKAKLKAQVDDFFEQMGRVQFSSIGTLGFTGAEGHSCRRVVDVVRGPHSQTLNDNQILGYRAFSLHQEHLSLGGRLHSTRQYISFLFKDLLNLHSQKYCKDGPTANTGSEERSTLYLLALAWRHLKQPIPPPDTNTASDATATRQERFILSHADLNPGNIIVCPVKLEITGVIDWEWAKVIPDTLECDPSWYKYLLPNAGAEDTSAPAGSHEEADDDTASGSPPQSPSSRTLRCPDTLVCPSTLESMTKLLRAARHKALHEFAAANTPASPGHSLPAEDSFFDSYLETQIDDFFRLPARREFLEYRLWRLCNGPYPESLRKELQQQRRARFARVEEDRRAGAAGVDDDGECCRSVQPDLAEGREQDGTLDACAEENDEAKLSTEDEFKWLCEVVGFEE